MIKFKNFTPHTIVMNDGRMFTSDGLARVNASFSDPKDGIVKQVFGDVQGLPPQQDDVKLIVSAMVLSASDRSDLVAPSSGHPLTKRNDKGHIVSVPYFVGK